MQYAVKKHKHHGFTLMEVMIVVVLVGIIAAVALPGYQNHVCKTQRQQLKSDMLAYAQALDQFYNTNSFNYLLPNNALPVVYENYSPSDGLEANKKFDMTLAVPDRESFTLSAQRSGGSCQDGVMTLTNNGTKTWTVNNVTRTNWNE